MEVHRSLTKHIQTKEQQISRFRELDFRREAAIERVLEARRAGQPYSLTEVNEYTRGIKQLAADTGLNLPERKYVTEEMVEAYVQRLTGKE